ncbi:hypothetical protein MHYP_G00003340 [Metynnis hypsauchen]
MPSCHLSTPAPAPFLYPNDLDAFRMIQPHPRTRNLKRGDVRDKGRGKKNEFNLREALAAIVARVCGVNVRAALLRGRTDKAGNSLEKQEGTMALKLGVALQGHKQMEK